VIFIEINVPSDLVELRGLEPLAPCLQNPFRVSSTVSGLEYLTSTVHRDPAKSKIVGVNLGCQPTPTAIQESTARFGRPAACNLIRSKAVAAMVFMETGLEGRC
jgi:hypothetical protein